MTGLASTICGTSCGTSCGKTRQQVRRSFREIAEDPALRAYGAVLALLQALFAWWILHDGHLRLLTSAVDPVCWPLVPGCASMRLLDFDQLTLLARVHGVLALMSAALFTSRRTAALGAMLLAALVAVQVTLVSVDFRLRRNQHYMHLAATLAFLLVPSRRDTVRLLVVLFYFWAGTLKLDPEWLTGAALYRPVWLFTGALLPVACAYVVVLELVVVWGLLGRNAVWFWAALAQLLVFHLFSFPVVGYFYPVLMTGILAIFPLARLVPAPGDANAPRSLLADLLRGRAPRATMATALAFSVLQLLPHLYPGDTALTGEGRLWGLHMFDARVKCEVIASIELDDGRTLQRAIVMSQETRVQCDPLVARAGALALCRKGVVGRSAIRRLDLRVKARRTSDPQLHTIVDIPDFCAHPPDYDPFFHNDWIAAVPR